jgi:hypothetical protein
LYPASKRRSPPSGRANPTFSYADYVKILRTFIDPSLVVRLEFLEAASNTVGGIFNDPVRRNLYPPAFLLIILLDTSELALWLAHDHITEPDVCC